MTVFYTRNKPKRKKLTAKQIRDLEDTKQSAQALKEKWDNEPTFARKKQKVKVKIKQGPPPLTTPPGRTTSNHLPSMVTPGGEATQKQKPVYTGTAMKGVATMHKSNSVPVFSDDHLVDIAKMRRNDYERDPKKNVNGDATSTDPLPW